MATLNWEDKSLGKRFVDISRLDFIQTDDFAPYWSIGCGAAIYAADISQRLFVLDAEKSKKKIFTYDYETGEFKNTGLSASDVDFFEYDENGGVVVVALKEDDEFTVDPILYSIDFKESGAE